MSAIGWVTVLHTIYEYCPLIWSFSILSLSITTWELKYRLNRMSERITELYGAKLVMLEGIPTLCKAISEILKSREEREISEEETLKSEIETLRSAKEILESLKEVKLVLDSVLQSLPEDEYKAEVEALRARLDKVEVRRVHHERTPQDATSDEKESL
ncbi:hypothetical protein SLS58_006000 [Diplodia intermedia]|uniref:Uncharacterized protein n=1 Tax=Diplodia intermedia TaxID=856260 RepID=A0ABR3TP52_9PEZI